MEAKTRMRNDHNGQKLICKTKTSPSGFEKKLAKYALAAGALVVLPVAAKGNDIVYSGPVDVVISGNASLPFSLDGGAPDFTLSTYVSSYNYGNGNYGYTGDSSLNGPGVDLTIPLAGGTSIDPSSSFGSGTTLSYRDEYAYSQQYSYSCGSFGKYTCYGYNYYGPYYSSSGSLPDDGNPYYIGLEFARNGQAYYGWAEIGNSVGYGSAEAELFDYAYDTNPGEAILAGQTANNSAPVPEPPALALFALGALGQLFRNRWIGEPDER